MYANPRRQNNVKQPSSIPCYNSGSCWVWVSHYAVHVSASSPGWATAGLYHEEYSGLGNLVSASQWSNQSRWNWLQSCAVICLYDAHNSLPIHNLSTIAYPAVNLPCMRNGYLSNALRTPGVMPCALPSGYSAPTVHDTSSCLRQTTRLP